MSNSGNADRRRWLVSAAVAVAILLGAGLLFQVPVPPAPSVDSPRKAAVQLVNPGPTDDLLRQETEIRDLRPMFLPTERNATLPELKREPGRSFLVDEDPKWRFAGADIQLGRELPPVATLNGLPVEKAAPVDALAVESAGIGLIGFGRRPVQTSVAPSSGVSVEVFAASDGRLVLSETLPSDGGPPGDKAWAPLEFLATIGAAGLSSPLLVTVGSGVESADFFFREHLARSFRIGERLPPGYYRVTVAP